jgi:hypothetical protein
VKVALIVLAWLVLVAAGMEYVTTEAPVFEKCMDGCDLSADACLSDDSLDDAGITACEETNADCYRRCASRETIRRARQAGHSLRCTVT